MTVSIDFNFVRLRQRHSFKFGQILASERLCLIRPDCASDSSGYGTACGSKWVNLDEITRLLPQPVPYRGSLIDF
jgi:hypothetical protein